MTGASADARSEARRVGYRGFQVSTGMRLPPWAKDETAGRVILNGSDDRYSEATREAVFDVARELGYRPNAAARAMRTGRFGAIGIVCSQEASHNTLSPGINHGIRERAAEHCLAVVESGGSAEQRA